MYIFSTKWADLDVSGIQGKFVDGIYRTESEKEAELLRRNKSIIEITQAFPPKEEPKQELTEVEKSVNVFKNKKAKIVAGARTVQEKEQT